MVQWWNPQWQATVLETPEDWLSSLVAEIAQDGAPVRNRVQLVQIPPISLWFMVDISNYLRTGL